MRGFLLFLFLVAGLDQLLGSGLDRAYRWTTADERVGQINFALQQDPDILVLGSSRTKHHVMPSILRARLGASVFNAGTEGQDFLYAVMLLELWTRSHHPPKALILNIDPESLARSDQEIERTVVFSPYFDRSETVRRILLMRGKYEWVKYVSYTYRFNGKVLQMLRNWGVRPDPDFDGFVGLEGSMNVDPASQRSGLREFETYAPWDVKLKYLKQLVLYCKTNGTTLFLITGPVFPTDLVRSAWSKQVSQLVASYPGAEFLDLSERTHQELFGRRPDLFRDGAHLNWRGAEIFSTLLADEISKRISVHRR